MDCVSKEVRFSFTEIALDGGALTEPWQVYLRIVGGFSVTVGGRGLYQEQGFCLVEFAVNSKLWLEHVKETEEDFIFTSQESDESGLVWVKKVAGGWRLGSIHQEYEETSVFDLDSLRAPLCAYFDGLRKRVEECFGVDIAAVVVWAEDSKVRRD